MLAKIYRHFNSRKSKAGPAELLVQVSSMIRYEIVIANSSAKYKVIIKNRKQMNYSSKLAEGKVQ